MARLVSAYDCVLLPFGNGKRYDLVVETEGKFLRVQCKTGRIRNGCILFNTHSIHRNGADYLGRGYHGQADLFGIYCPDNDKIYLVPVEDVPETTGTLRLEIARNNQQTKVRWAHKYELMPA